MPANPANSPVFVLYVNYVRASGGYFFFLLLVSPCCLRILVSLFLIVVADLPVALAIASFVQPS